MNEKKNHGKRRGKVYGCQTGVHRKVCTNQGKETKLLNISRSNAGNKSKGKKGDVSTKDGFLGTTELKHCPTKGESREKN